MTMQAPLTAVVITKNEELALPRCLRALEFCNQVIVLDSCSTDRTVEIAAEWGAQVIEFNWNGKYPKKKQWGMDLDEVRNDWVLHLDGDEVVSEELRSEIVRELGKRRGVVAYDIPVAYHFMGRELRYGHRVHKRSLVNRRYVRFPDVGDSAAPGITEVEGHYQPVADGQVASLASRLIHDDPDPLSDWIARHNRYSDWEAYLARHPQIRQSVRTRRTLGGQAFDRVPLKPVAFFFYAYILKLGFLDGRAGLDYAVSLSWYYWTISAKLRHHRRLDECERNGANKD